MTPPPALAAPARRSPGSPLRRVLAQARYESATTLRNGEQLLVTIVLPLIALVVLTTTTVVPLPGDRASAALASALALAVASGFTSQAIAVAFDRRWGVLRLLATTPLGPGGLLAGKLLAFLAVLAVQAAVLVVAALVLGWSPGRDAGAVLGAAVLVLLGAAAFVSLALLVGGTLRAEAVLAVANLLWVLLAGVGGLLVPATNLPGPLPAVVPWLPSGALGEGLRGLAAGGGLDPLALLVLAVWAAVAAWLAARLFRWE